MVHVTVYFPLTETGFNADETFKLLLLALRVHLNPDNCLTSAILSLSENFKY